MVKERQEGDACVTRVRYRDLISRCKLLSSNQDSIPFSN